MSGQSLGVSFANITLVINFQLKKPNGTPEDLTGATVRFGLAEECDLTNPFLTKSSGSGITITDAVNGKGQIVLGKGEVTKTGRLWYNVSATLANGDFYTYEQGYGNFKEAMFSS